MNVTLYQPDIAANLGAVMRLCAGFNVPLSVIEPCGFPLSEKALRRAAMDYVPPGGLNRTGCSIVQSRNECSHYTL